MRNLKKTDNLPRLAPVYDIFGKKIESEKKAKFNQKMSTLKSILIITILLSPFIVAFFIALAQRENFYFPLKDLILRGNF